MITVRVQTDDFDLGRELDQLRAGRTDMGALVSFTGIVRANPKAPLDEMVLEHYPGMTEKALTGIARNATERWSLSTSLIIHRVGPLLPGAQIMMVAAGSAHRQAAFEAADFMMDFLKSRAPFWKKEINGESAEWVDARDTDEAALRRWS